MNSVGFNYGFSMWLMGRMSWAFDITEKLGKNLDCDFWCVCCKRKKIINKLLYYKVFLHLCY